MDAHMDFLQTLHSFGIIGMVLYCMIYFNALKFVFKQRKQCGTEAKHLYYISLITVIITLFAAYSNCLILNPLIISPAIFILGYAIGIIYGYQQTHRIKKYI